MALRLYSRFMPLVRSLSRGSALGVALAGMAMALAVPADAQTPTRDDINGRLKTAWENFGVCPDKETCAGWTRVANGGTNTVSGTHAKATGTNRLLLVAVFTDYGNGAETTFAPTVTYGGQTATRATSSDASSTQKTWIGYFTESQVAAATGAPPTLSCLISPVNANETTVWAAYFTGVNQTTPVGASAASASSDTATANISFPGTGVAYGAGDTVIYATNVNQGASAALPPLIDASTIPDTRWIEEVDFPEGAQMRASIGSVERSAAGSSDDTVVLEGAEKWAISVVALKPSGSKVTFPNARYCVAPCSNILWNNAMPRDFHADGGGPREDFTSSTTVSTEVEISSGWQKPGNPANPFDRNSENCNPGCPFPVGCTPGVSCLCETNEGSCGGVPSAFYSYHYDSSKDMAYLFGRMRIGGNPTGGSIGVLGTGFVSSHWNLLVSFDNDPFKEFWVDVNGGCVTTVGAADCVNVYYWNGNSGTTDPTTLENNSTTNQINNTCDTPGRTASASSNCADTSPSGFIKNRVNRFLGCTDDSHTNGPGPLGATDCAVNSVSRAIWIKDSILDSVDDWYVDVQIPMAALTTYNGENPAEPETSNIGQHGAQAAPYYTWDPNRSNTTCQFPGTEACEFYPLIQTLHPGGLEGPPWGGSGPFSYKPNTAGLASTVPQTKPGYLRLNYATCQSNTDPLQKDFLFPGTSPSDTTPVTLSRFKSTPTARGHMVEWTTVNEVANAGFDILALGPFGWVKVNHTLIPSRATDVFSPQDYVIEVPFHAVTQFKIVDVDVDERPVEHGPFKAGEEFGGRRPVARVDWPAVAAENGSKAVQRQTAARTKSSQKVSAAASMSVGAMGAQAGFADYPELRLRVKKNGIYRVTYEAMAAAGVNLAGVPAALVSLESRAGSVPLRVETGKGSSFGPGSFVEFYGEAVKSLYTATNVYRLAVKPRNAGVQKDPAPAGKAKPAAFYLETAEVHQNRLWNPNSAIDDPWSDDRIVAVGGPVTRNYTVDLDNIVAAGTGASVSIGLWAETQKNHVRAYLNGTFNMLADSTFPGNQDATITTPISTSLLVPGPNTITLHLPFDQGTRFEIDHLDRYSITYPRAFVAKGGKLEFTASGDAFKVSGLPSSSVVVYRIGARKVELLTGASVSGAAGNYQVTFRGSADAARYVVSTEATLLSPELVPVPETTDPTVGSAQYVVISHPDFIDGLDELVAAKEAQGLTVKVVDVNDVYEKFSFGVLDPWAIKSFVAQAAGTGTEYVLLVGGDSFDYLGYRATPSISFIPTFYTRTSTTIGFAPADGIFADLDADAVADVAIGRIPARSSADLAAAIEKTLAYAPASRSAIFAADEKSATDNYANVCDAATEALGAEWNVTKAYVDDLGVAGAKSVMLDAINGGTALTTFVGHSDVTYWSFRQLFTTADIPNLTNGDEPTVVAQWGCWNTFFSHPSLVSLGDRFLVTPGRGAAAVIGPSALSETGSDLYISKAFSAELAGGNTVGKALTAAKARVKAEHPDAFDVLRATNLMGDPALLIP